MFLRIILIVLGILFTLYGLQPLYTILNLNAGMITFFAAGVILILCGIFYKNLASFNHKMLSGRGTKAVFITAVSILCAVFAVFAGTFIKVVSYGGKTPEKMPALIVLGCQVRGKTPSLQLRYRANAAYDYLKENPESIAILSGGQGPDEEITEAQCLFNVLAQKGISPTRLIIEDKSVNTEQNIKNSISILKGRGLPLEAAVATSDYHEYRTSIICKKQGLKTTPVSAKTDFWSRPAALVREVYGVWYYTLFK